MSDPLRIGCRQVNLIEHRNYRKMLVYSLIQSRERLRLDPLRCVDEQNGSFHCSERTRDFVLEIDVSRGIYQIEFISFPMHPGRRQLDGDPPFLFDIHAVKHLIVIYFPDCSGDLKHPIRQGGFSVIYMCDDTKIAYVHDE